MKHLKEMREINILTSTGQSKISYLASFKFLNSWTVDQVRECKYLLHERDNFRISRVASRTGVAPVITNSTGNTLTSVTRVIYNITRSIRQYN